MVNPCWIQSMIALSLLVVCFGNGTAVGRVARHFGSGNGTITLFTRRFITAILNLNDKYRLFALKRIPGVVGILDGT